MPLTDLMTAFKMLQKISPCSSKLVLNDMNAARVTDIDIYICRYIYGAFEVTGKFLTNQAGGINKDSVGTGAYTPIITSEMVTFNLIRGPAQVLHRGLMPGITPAQRERHAPLYGHASVKRKRGQ